MLGGNGASAVRRERDKRGCRDGSGDGSRVRARFGTRLPLTPKRRRVASVSERAGVEQCGSELSPCFSGRKIRAYFA